MEKKKLTNILKKVRENSRERKFDQTIDLIINLKQLDLKKEEHKQDHFVTLPAGRGKKLKICALVDKELSKEAEANCDKVVLDEEFPNLKKQEIKRLANDYNFFIAQANLMGAVAKTFGRVLGTRGKMPNPKAGCVVPGSANLKPLVTKLQKTVRIITKNEQIIKVPIGTESMKDEDLIENIIFIHSHLEHSLPQGKNNIKNVLLKTTMGKSINIEEKNETNK